jgi:hypothetical protein
MGGSWRSVLGGSGRSVLGGSGNALGCRMGVFCADELLLPGSAENADRSGCSDGALERGCVHPCRMQQQELYRVGMGSESVRFTSVWVKVSRF